MDRESGAIFAREDLKEPGRLTRFLSRGLWANALFLGIYFALSIAVRLILPNSLTLDEAEQSLFSQYWLAGYGPQPPFYNWVQNAFVRVMGISLFSLMLPKFLMLFLCSTPRANMGECGSPAGRTPVRNVCSRRRASSRPTGSGSTPTSR